MAPVGNDEEDLTRRERREQARANRKAAEEAAAASAVRRKRMTQLGGAVVIVVVAIVVILIATSGGGKKATEFGKGHETKHTPVVAKVEKELNGIPQSGKVLGSPTAPVTLVYFGDLECPYCAEFTQKALPGVIEKLVRPGKLKVEYRNLETATREPETFRTQQVAAMAAGAQNKLWYYIELFYNQQGEEDSGYVTESFLQGLAQQVPGLNLSQWSSDRNNGEYAKLVEKDAEAASNEGFTGTPSFLLGKNGSFKKLTNSEYGTYSESSGFETAIDKVLNS